MIIIVKYSCRSVGGVWVKVAEELGVSIDYLAMDKADEGLGADTKKALLFILEQLYKAGVR